MKGAQVQVFSRAAIAVVTTAVVAAPAGAASRPDLVVSKLAEPPAQLAPGAQLTVADSLRNAGSARARASTVAYWLSADRKQAKGDIRLGQRTAKTLKGRRTATGKRTLSLPAVLRAGSYYLIACADGGRKVRERSEKNNCRASRQKLTIVVALGAPAPSPTATPGPLPTAEPTPAPTAGPQPTPTATPAPAPSDTPSFPMDPDPLEVSHTKQTDQAVTQLAFASIENVITATAADGTSYELVIPAKALASNTEITLTPISSVADSPLKGGLIGAVEILPHGLQLLQAATLTIDPAGDPGPIGGQTGFLSHEEGEDFHLYPLGMGDAITMKLTHFSTPGVSQASDADRSAALSHPPSRERAQLAAANEAALREARESGGELPSDALAANFAAYYDGVIDPLVTQAKTDDALAERTVAELISWGREIDFLSLQGHPAVEADRDALFANIKAIMENAITKGYTHCVDEHDIDYVLRLIRLARVSAQLGLTLGEDALDKAYRCGHFEIDLDSVITQDYTLDGTESSHRGVGTWHVGTPQRVPVDFFGSFINLQGVLSYEAFDYDYTITLPPSNGCSRVDRVVDVSAASDSSVWFLLQIDLNLREPGTPPPPSRGISLRIAGYGEAGTLEETYQESTPQSCGGEVNDDLIKRSTWRQEFHGSGDDGLFENWQMGTPGADLLATKSYWDSGGAGMAEQTRLELWHTPIT